MPNEANGVTEAEELRAQLGKVREAREGIQRKLEEVADQIGIATLGEEGERESAHKRGYPAKRQKRVATLRSERSDLEEQLGTVEKSEARITMDLLEALQLQATEQQRQAMEELAEMQHEFNAARARFEAKQAQAAIARDQHHSLAERLHVAKNRLRTLDPAFAEAEAAEIEERSKEVQAGINRQREEWREQATREVEEQRQREGVRSAYIPVARGE